MSMWKRAQESIAQGALTNSKHPRSFVGGISPTHCIGGNGVHLTTAENGEFLDYMCALGANLVGYGNAQIGTAIHRQMLFGITHSLPTTIEIAAANSIKQIAPFAERVKFLKTGTDAAVASLKIARAYTGRKQVLSDGYHGWSDEFVSLTPPALGCVGGDFIHKLSDLSQITSDTAAVIIEAVVTDWSPERGAYLQKLRERCTQVGAMLIFDEIITGLRFPSFTVARHFNIDPDIMLLGKALGGGLPLSAVLGKAKVMDGDYFVSSTFAGETLSLAAMMEMLRLLMTSPRYRLQDLWEAGAIFQERFNAIDPGVIKIEGYPTRGRFVTPDSYTWALFLQEMALAKILFCKSFFFAFGHAQHTDMVIRVAHDVIGRIRRGAVQLKGEPPVEPFAARVRGNA